MSEGVLPRRKFRYTLSGFDGDCCTYQERWVKIINRQDWIPGKSDNRVELLRIGVSPYDVEMESEILKSISVARLKVYNGCGELIEAFRFEKPNFETKWEADYHDGVDLYITVNPEQTEYECGEKA